jgi:hypothetical protein
MGAMNASDQTILRRRNRRNPYTTISNTPLQDKRLSLEAIGLLVCVLSLPEHWAFSRKDAIARFGVKRDKLDRILRELKEIGYVLHEQVRDARGRLSHSLYIFSDEPGQFDESEPCPEKPEAVTVSGKTGSGSAGDGLAVSGQTAPIKRKQREKLTSEESAGAPDSEISWKRWEDRLRSYVNRRGRWPDKWGPPPGAKGCEVPRRLLEKYQSANDARNTSARVQ